MNIIVLCIGKSRYGQIDEVREFLHLAESNDFNVLYLALAVVHKPSPSTYIHSGYLDHIATVCCDLKPDFVVCNLALKSRYQRNLEKYLKVNFIDRTELLLSLFEKRATSSAGKLQVELARLSYLQTKLVRGWTHLERQRGGIGLRGGPGETQIEVDRRILRENIHKTKKKLNQLTKTRTLNRQRRQNDATFVMSLVGYTNAGKSTLFNLLTNANSFANDQLFATLDPLVRAVKLPDVHKRVVLIDTVGFMRDLPSELLSAFHSTLEEIIYSDLILHVIDSSDPEMGEKVASVEKTLCDIGADDIETFKVFNKSDLVPDFNINQHENSAVISANNKKSLNPLYQILKTYVNSH